MPPGKRRRRTPQRLIALFSLDTAIRHHDADVFFTRVTTSRDIYYGAIIDAGAAAALICAAKEAVAQWRHFYSALEMMAAVLAAAASKKPRVCPVPLQSPTKCLLRRDASSFPGPSLQPAFIDGRCQSQATPEYEFPMLPFRGASQVMRRTDTVPLSDFRRLCHQQGRSHSRCASRMGRPSLLSNALMALNRRASERFSRVF